LSPVRRSSVSVEVGAALSLVGTLLKYLSLSALLPVAFALGYSEPVWPFVAAGAIAAVAGLALERLGDRERAGLREGFLVVALTWLLAAIYGMLPYLFAGQGSLGSPVNALFESMSGFTTTGSTVVVDYGTLSHSMAMWRQFTQWLGGMGIVVLALAVLPRLRVGGRQMLEHELPGPELESLSSTIRSTAGRFVVLYIALSALEVAVLTLIGLAGLDDEMGPYEALAHAFTTMSTGGFSPRPDSLAAFAAVTQWAVVAFMVLAGTNFALLFRTFVRRQTGAALRDDEFRVYAVALVVGTAILLAELLRGGLASGEAAFREAVFQTVAIATTTGYANADFSSWTALAAVTIVGLMFVSASAGSTAGGPKLVRHVLIGRMVRRELDQAVHPELVAPIRFNRRVVDERILRGAVVFVLLYVALFALGTLGLVIDAARSGVEVSPFDATAAAATTIGNVGPGLGFAGPYGSFEPFSDLSKAIMIVLMWLGRLEIVPVVLLLTRGYWRA
jgi:trk system potassium uptake protein TrkH